jgi:hypothetical protein
MKIIHSDLGWSWHCDNGTQVIPAQYFLTESAAQLELQRIEEKMHHIALEFRPPEHDENEGGLHNPSFVPLYPNEMKL